MEQINSITKVEPRILHVQKMISHLLSIVDLEYQGQKVLIDGFKLKDLKHWVSRNDHRVEDFVALLARKCDADCEFCYHKGNPEDFALGKKDDFVTEEELETRIHYFSEGDDENLALFTANYEQKEALYDEKALKYLRILRKKSKHIITINTNGLGLTSQTIQELSLLNPILVVFSLNSIDQNKRDLVMRNSKSNNSIEILEQLSKQKMNFVTSVAMWPTIEVEDIKRAIITAANYDPYFIRLIMPGYTDHFARKPTENFSDHFDECIEMIWNLRKKIEIPLVVYPEAYVAKKYKMGNKAYLIGVVKGSPLYHAGLKSGDVFSKINGLPVEIRANAKTYLKIMASSLEPFPIEYLRNNEFFTATVNPNIYEYPYTTELNYAPLGALMSGALQKSYIRELEQIIQEEGARKVLVMTSELMKIQAEELMDSMKVPLNNESRSIKLYAPKNYYLGGNIAIGDMLTCYDYIKAIDTLRSSGEEIDLIVIPASVFWSSSGWRRDLGGVYYKEVEWSTGIKTRLLECACFIF